MVLAIHYKLQNTLVSRMDQFHFFAILLENSNTEENVGWRMSYRERWNYFPIWNRVELKTRLKHGCRKMFIIE